MYDFLLVNRLRGGGGGLFVFLGFAELEFPDAHPLVVRLLRGEEVGYVVEVYRPFREGEVHILGLFVFEVVEQYLYGVGGWGFVLCGESLLGHGLPPAYVGVQLLAEVTTEYGLGLGRRGDVYPVELRLLAFGCEYLYLIAALEFVAEGDELVIHFRAYAVEADVGVEVEGEVESRGLGG